MANKITKIVALCATLSLSITGCAGTSFNEETFSKLEHIGSNINTISEGFSDEATAELTESIAQASETAQELTDTYNEKMAEGEEEVTTEEVAAEEEIISGEDDNTEEVTIGSIDDEDVLARIRGNILEELLKYREMGEKFIIEALTSRDNGLGKIRTGLKAFNATFENVADDTYIVDIVDDSFDSTKEILDGANEVAAGATVVLTQATEWTQEIVDTARLLGVESAELDEAQKILDSISGTKIEFVSESAIDDLEKYRDYAKSQVPEDATVGDVTNGAKKEAKKQVEDKVSDIKIEMDIEIYENPKEYLEDSIKQADEVVKKANEALAQAEELYKVANEAAKEIIDKARAAGADKVRIDNINNLVETYEDMIEDGIGMSKNDLTSIKKSIDAALKLLKSSNLF